MSTENLSRADRGRSTSKGSGSSQKTLIICIDRDNDLGIRTGLQTPILGKDACLSAASRLALSDPEEADANAIFAAIREYDHLLSRGFDCEVVIVSGLFERGVLGDKKIRSEIQETLDGYPAEAAVLVSDGAEGEQLVPIIQTLVPIISIRQVVVKHSKTVEESYQVLGKYLKMLIFDPRYSRYALGVPGILFIGFVIISLVAPHVAPELLTVIIGIIFIVRGFEIDKKIESIGNLSAAGYLRLFATIASLLITLGGIVYGASVFYVKSSCLSVQSFGQTLPCQIPGSITSSQAVFSNAPKIAGYFIEGSQLYVWIGLGLYITTAIFFDLLRPRARHMARNVVALVVLGLLYYPVAYFSNLLLTGATTIKDLTAIVLFAVAVNFSIAAYLFRYFSRRRRSISAIQVVDD